MQIIANKSVTSFHCRILKIIFESNVLGELLTCEPALIKPDIGCFDQDATYVRYVERVIK